MLKSRLQTGRAAYGLQQAAENLRRTTARFEPPWHCECAPLQSSTHHALLCMSAAILYTTSLGHYVCCFSPHVAHSPSLSVCVGACHPLLIPALQSHWRPPTGTGACRTCYCAGGEPLPPPNLSASLLFIIPSIPPYPPSARSISFIYLFPSFNFYLVSWGIPSFCIFKMSTPLGSSALYAPAFTSPRPVSMIFPHSVP